MTISLDDNRFNNVIQIWFTCNPPDGSILAMIFMYRLTSSAARYLPRLSTLRCVAPLFVAPLNGVLKRLNNNFPNIRSYHLGICDHDLISTMPQYILNIFQTLISLITGHCQSYKLPTILFGNTIGQCVFLSGLGECRATGMKPTQTATIMKSLVSV